MFWLRRVFFRVEVELALAALALALATLAVWAALEKRDMDGMLWPWFLGRVDQRISLYGPFFFFGYKMFYFPFFSGVRVVRCQSLTMHLSSLCGSSALQNAPSSRQGAAHSTPSARETRSASGRWLQLMCIQAPWPPPAHSRASLASIWPVFLPASCNKLDTGKFHFSVEIISNYTPKLQNQYCIIRGKFQSYNCYRGGSAMFPQGGAERNSKN